MDRLCFVGGLAWWLIVIVSVGALAAIGYQFLGLRRRLGMRRAIPLTALRAIVYSLLVFFLLSPGLVQTRVTKLRRPLNLLIDTSKSMGLPGPSGKSRVDNVKEKITGGNDTSTRRPERDYDLRIFQF